MIKSTIAIIAFLSFLQISCYKDNTTEDIFKISDIEIELPNIDQSEVNIDKNETLTILPDVAQTMSDKALHYEWQVANKIVSTEKEFKYTATALGLFPVQLKVTNEDGSTFKRFNLRVNSPYEEGLMVLGEDEQGEGTLSFMRRYSSAELASGKIESFATNLFALNNPGSTIGKRPTDVVKRLNQLFISSGEDGKISLINDKTLELESVISSEFSDFKPLILNIPDATATSSIVLNEDGQLFTVASRENLILRNTLTTTVPLLQNARFSLKAAVFATINFTSNYLWDEVNSRLWNFWYLNTSSKDVLANQELIHFFPANGFVYVLTKDKADPSKLMKTVFGEYIQEYFSDPVELIDQQIFTNGAPTLKENSVTLLNDKYLKLVYANERSIYQWFYTGENIPSSPYITINIPGVITSMASNPEGTLLYVGVYNAAASGLKGSVLVYNIDNGALINTYEAVADKPVKLFYKTK